MRFLQFGGGLGDIFMRMHTCKSFEMLDDLVPGEIAHVAFTSVNPCAPELLAYHPKRGQMIVNVYPHWWPQEDAAMRTIYNLPPLPDVMPRLDPYKPVKVYRNPTSKIDLKKPYMVIQACAGESWKSIPLATAQEIVNHVAKTMPVVAIGRSYAGQRETYRRVEYGLDNTINLVDKIDIPDTIHVLRNATGVIACSSFSHMVAWLNNIPMFILYPELLFEKCISLMLKDQLNFGSTGLLRATTVHGLFSDYSQQMLDYWLSAVL